MLNEKKSEQRIMLSTPHHADLVILGSGSTAFAAALHAAELNKTVVMTELRTVGASPGAPLIPFCFRHRWEPQPMSNRHARLPNYVCGHSRRQSPGSAPCMVDIDVHAKRCYYVINMSKGAKHAFA